MSDTPLTDKEEHFILHEARHTSGLGFTSKKEGYVSSEFARKLELRIQELESQLRNQNED